MSIESYIRAMPKVELDIQLEGTMRKETLLLIAEQNDVPDNLKHFNQWVHLLDQPDYARLDEITRTVGAWLQLPEDLTRVVYDLGVLLAKQNVRYAEVGVNPLLYMENGITFEQFLIAINDGRSRAERGWKVRLNWVLNLPRDQYRRADDLLRWATGTTAKKGGVVGVGLSGREDAQPASQFERPFRTAQKKGLPRAVHAGEMLGAEGSLEALQQLQPERLIDGWETADAPDVLRLLTENNTALNVCMARWLCSERIEQYGDYPLRQLYDEGVKLTLTSHMPNFYKTSLNDEYLAAVEHNGFSAREMEELTVNAIQASFMPDEEKLSMSAEFTEAFAALRAEHGVEADA